MDSPINERFLTLSDSASGQRNQRELRTKYLKPSYHRTGCPVIRRSKSFVRGRWSRLDACQDYFFTVSQQDIDRPKASIREQTDPPHCRQPVPDTILIVRRVAEEAIIVPQ